MFVFCQKAERTVEHVGDSDTNVYGIFGMVPKGLEKRLGELDIRGRI